MQVGYRSDFYRQISQITSGAHLRIDNASFTYDMLMAICLREGSLKLLKVEVRQGYSYMYFTLVNSVSYLKSCCTIYHFINIYCDV